MSARPGAPGPEKPDATHELGRGARRAGAVVWSAFLAAALATMLCFAFLDPLEFRLGNPPHWWTTRLHVYGIGFFFFWLVGLVAAAVCWRLTHGGRRDD